MTTLQRSPLYASHAAAGAHFQAHLGWELPQWFGDPAAEYRAALEERGVAAALHDRSHAGRLRAAGKDALDLLHRLSTNAVRDLAPGQGAPTVLTTDRGRILDLVTVVNLGSHVLLLTSPGAQQTVAQWLDKYTIMEDLTVTDVTAATALLCVLGPGSRAAVEQAAGLDLAGLPPWHALQGQAAGQALWVIRHPLGELPGWCLVVDSAAAAPVWQAFREAGLPALGQEAYQALRVVQGVPALGAELGEEYNPLEAGLIGAISFTKGCYIGQEVIARLDSYHRVQKHLAALRFAGGAQAVPGGELRRDGQTVGTVTSVAPAAVAGEPAGLGYVRTAVTPGTRLELGEPGQGWAEVVRLPLLFGPGAG
jgi:folate-binding protein YgfZ